MNSPVLLYHKIDRPTPDVKIRGAFTHPRRFERQMSWLKRNGFKFYTASQFVSHYSEFGRFPDRGICITFDDGWKDNYLNAFPVLRELGIRATIFIVTSCIGSTTDKVTAEGEGKREHLSESDIREMAAAGIEFGSHSMDHKLFDRTQPAEIELEVTGSKAYIENLLQTECKTFAYPAGFYTLGAKDIVRDAGYIGAFSTVYGPGDAPDVFALNRSEVLRRHGYPFRFPRYIRSIFA